MIDGYAAVNIEAVIIHPHTFNITMSVYCFITNIMPKRQGPARSNIPAWIARYIPAGSRVWAGLSVNRWCHQRIFLPSVENNIPVMVINETKQVLFNWTPLRD